SSSESMPVSPDHSRSTSSSTTSPRTRPRRSPSGSPPPAGDAGTPPSRPPAPGTLAPPLHANLELLGQPGGTLVQGAHRQASTPRRLHQRSGADRSHREMG